MRIIGTRTHEAKLISPKAKIVVTNFTYSKELELSESILSGIAIEQMCEYSKTVEPTNFNDIWTDTRG